MYIVGGLRRDYINTYTHTHEYTYSLVYNTTMVYNITTCRNKNALTELNTIVGRYIPYRYLYAALPLARCKYHTSFLTVTGVTFVRHVGPDKKDIYLMRFSK